MAVFHKIDNAQADEARAELLPANPGQSRYPFFLQLHPREWTWEPGRGWVPSVGRLPLSPGVMGVASPVRQGAPVDSGPAVLQAERAGWIVIKDQSEYLGYTMTVAGRRCYHTRWDKPDIYHGSVDWEHDKAGYLEYILSKVGTDPGRLIEPCRPKLKDRKISAFMKRLQRIERQATDNPGNGAAQRRFETATRQMAAMQAERAGEPFEHIEAGREPHKAEKAPRVTKVKSNTRKTKGGLDAAEGPSDG